MRRPPARRAARRLLPVVLIAALSLIAASFAPAPAGAASGGAADYVSRINALRASAGVQPLQVDGELTSIAQNWANHMASVQQLSHSPSLSAGISSQWLKLAENVGYGPNNSTVWSAFLASAGHYANLVDPAFNRVGVGVAENGGYQYTCHRFMQVAGGGGGGGGGGSSTGGGGSSGGSGSSSGGSGSKSRPSSGGSGRSSGGTPPTTAAPAPAPVIPPAPQPGPPPPADQARVATVLAALRHLAA